MSYQVPLGYVPISSNALRPLGTAYIPILLSEVEQEQRPTGNDDQRAGSFLKQRISMALQIGNAACVVGTVSDRDAFEEIYYI